MKTAIYSPYLDTAGGGEKYMLTIAEICAEFGQVDILLNKDLFKVGEKYIREKNSNLHNINFAKINFVQAPLNPKDSFFKRNAFLKKYDLLFYNSDGSVFYSTAKKSILHFQMPITTIQKGLWSYIKVKSWKLAIFNSKFTMSYIKQNLGLDSLVVYPPVDIQRFKPSSKKKHILNVGRFMGEGIKKQQVMIDVFKDMYIEGDIADWSLHLAGGVGEGDEEFFKLLEDKAKGFPITLYPNISFEDLTKLYEQSAIYWHAMGFGEEDPKLMEHFGITTVESMAAECVPIVINKGGQTEIIEDGESGLLWSDTAELKDLTIKLVKDVKLREKLAKNAKRRSQKFSKHNFREQILSIINE